MEFMLWITTSFSHVTVIYIATAACKKEFILHAWMLANTDAAGDIIIRNGQSNSYHKTVLRLSVYLADWQVLSSFFNTNFSWH